MPGVGLALIDRGKVVWQGGVGVRKLGSPEPVDAHTKFMIASNTKGMSTLLLSILADEGKLRWDERSHRSLPALPAGQRRDTTSSTQVRHLVCACTGLPRKDYAFILADQRRPGAGHVPAALGDPADQQVRRAVPVQQSDGRRPPAISADRFVYPKMEIGAAYDRAMQEKIFGPLGMRDTTFDFAKGESGDWAPPHGFDVDGRLTVMSNYFNRTVYPYRPAGGAFSSAADMARYVQLELSKGVAPTARGWSARPTSSSAASAACRSARTIGTAWACSTASPGACPVVTHGGTLQGYHSDWWALPDEGIGAVVLTNSDSGPALLDAFLRRLLEVAYDGKPRGRAGSRRRRGPAEGAGRRPGARG